MPYTKKLNPISDCTLVALRDYDPAAKEVLSKLKEYRAIKPGIHINVYWVQCLGMLICPVGTFPNTLHNDLGEFKDNLFYNN